MKVAKAQTETYILTDVEGLPSKLNVFVTKLDKGRGRIIIECFGSCWVAYFGGMKCQTVQELIFGMSDGHIMGRLSMKVHHRWSTKIITAIKLTFQAEINK